jgi:HKD family nuclease
VNTGPIHLLNTLENSSDYHTCVILSYGADLAFYEELVLRPLWVRNCRYHLVFIDAQRYRDLTKQQPEGANLIGRHYVVVPVDLGFLQSFHSKLILLLGDNGGRLLVGSGNLTFSGFGSNLEVYTSVDYSKSDTSALFLFQQVWNMILSLQKQYGHSRQADQILINAANRFTWLRNQASQLEETWFLHTLESPLLEQICQVLSNDTIRKATIISPFLDSEGKAVREIYRRLKPDEIKLIVQNQKAVANPISLDRLRAEGIPISLHLTSNDEPRYLHAKVYILEGERHNWVITGSANCTSAALLKSTRQGNFETVLVRKYDKSRDFTYLLDALNVSPLAYTPDQIIWKPQSEEPQVRQQQIYLLDATLHEHTITLRFTLSEPLASGLHLKAVISDTYHLPLQMVPDQDFSITNLPDEVYQQALGKPMLLYIEAMDEFGHAVDLGCNTLWINQSDELNSIRRGLPLLDIKAASYLADGIFASESEWNELRQSLARLIEIETRYIQNQTSHIGRFTNRSRASDQAQTEPTETEVFFTDESMVEDAEAEEASARLVYQETLEAFFEHLRSRLPGRQKETLLAEVGRDIAVHTSKPPTPPTPSTARQFQYLIRKYVDSLRNLNYMQNVPVEHVPQYYFLLNRVLWFLRHHQGISEETFLLLLRNMTTGLLGSGDEKAPLLEARSQRLIKRSLQKEWASDFAPIYALANAVVVEELSLSDQHNSFIDITSAEAEHCLASIFIVNGIPDFDSIDVIKAVLEIEEIMGQSVKNIATKLQLFVDQHLHKTIDLLAHWKQETILARKGVLDLNEVIRLEYAILDYCITRYDALKKIEEIDLMIEEASDGIFWAEKLGITESMSYFRNELIGLLSKKGELGLLARNYYENGKIADLEGRHDDAIRFLQQALVLAEKTGLVTIAMGSQVRLKSLLSEI